MSRRRSGPSRQAPVAVLVATFLFNLGQGVLRPALPLYLRQFFSANYRMVTMIPVVFGAGKWVASLPTGYLLDRLGRKPLMMAGLFLIACIDVASAMTSAYLAFLGLRALGGIGWAMFGTVATTAVVGHQGSQRRGRTVSLLLMSETLGLLLGSALGGLLYEGMGMTTPFVFEAACMLLAVIAVACQEALPPPPRASFANPARRDHGLLETVVRIPGVLLMCVASGALIAINAGVLVFLYPLYLSRYGHLRPVTVGYFVGLTVLGRLLALWFGGSLSDRWGRMTVMIPGLLAYAALLGSLTLVTDSLLLGLWAVMIGGAGGVVAGIPTAVIGDRVSPELQGVAIGWLRMVTDTGHVVGPLLFGVLADALHLSTPFLVAAALLSLIAWRCRRQMRADARRPVRSGAAD